MVLPVDRRGESALACLPFIIGIGNQHRFNQYHVQLRRLEALSGPDLYLFIGNCTDIECKAVTFSTFKTHIRRDKPVILRIIIVIDTIVAEIPLVFPAVAVAVGIDYSPFSRVRCALEIFRIRDFERFSGHYTVGCQRQTGNILIDIRHNLIRTHDRCFRKERIGKRRCCVL